MSDLTRFFVENFENLAPFVFYLIVGTIIFVETGVLLGFFLPGDSLLFAAGIVAASHGNINPAILAIVVFSAAFLGDQVGFAFGRVIGRPYLDRRKSPKIQKMIAKSDIYYQKYGFWAVVGSRFIPWVRTFVPPIAGTSSMNYYKFLLANSLGALIWGVGITMSGYYAASIPWVKTWAVTIGWVFITLWLLSLTVNFVRHRQVLRDK
jgi:membrane-associated protein